MIDAEITGIHPAETRNLAAMSQRDVEVEAGVERVAEAIFSEDVFSIAAMHFLHCRDHDLRRKRNGCEARGRCERAIQHGGFPPDSTPRIGAEGGLLAT